MRKITGHDSTGCMVEFWLDTLISLREYLKLIKILSGDKGNMEPTRNSKLKLMVFSYDLTLIQHALPIGLAYCLTEANKVSF